MNNLQKMSFGNVLLANSGKRGILNPLSDGSGYYRLCGGGFNIDNRSGIQYVVNDYIRECMRPDSDLNRRVSNGAVLGEMGHPLPYFYEKINGNVVRTEITDIFQWVLRLKTIDVDRVCFHIRKIEWEMRGGPKDPVYNFVEIKPQGKLGYLFKECIENPDSNTAISIRTVITPTRIGDTRRNTEYLTGYDWVPEPGMMVACKHLAAGLEGYLGEYFDKDMVKETPMLVGKYDDIVQLFESEVNKLNANPLHAGTESHMAAIDALKMIKNIGVQNKTVKILTSSSPLSLF